MTRRYCGRTGRAVEYDPPAPCPECRRTQGPAHLPTGEGECGHFVPCEPPCWIAPKGHGHACSLAPGHDGACFSGIDASPNPMALPVTP